MVLLGQCVLRLLKDAKKCVLIKSVQSYYYRHTSYKLRNQSITDQVLRHYLLEQFTNILFLFGSDFCAKANCLGILSSLNDLLQTVKGTAADKQNICSINLDEFLMRMLSSTLWRNRSYSSL